MAEHFRGTDAQLDALIEGQAAALEGRGPDPHGLARRIQLAVGTSVLSSVQQDYVTLSRGGSTSWRGPWDPLKPQTIAQRRTTADERKAAGLTSANKHRGLLTASENERWKKIFGQVFARLRMKAGEAEAKAIAARIAWAKLKAEGAKTKLQLFGGRKVDIGRDTGRLLRSLSPGATGGPANEDQVFDTPPGEVIVGTNVNYASRFFAKRPAWPEGGELPPKWRERATAAAAEAFRAALFEAIRNGRV